MHTSVQINNLLIENELSFVNGQPRTEYLYNNFYKY